MHLVVHIVPVVSADEDSLMLRMRIGGFTVAEVALLHEMLINADNDCALSLHDKLFEVCTCRTI